MNHDPNDVKNGELDQTRLTAYALEQLEGAERAAVEAILAGSDRSRQTVEEIRALAAEVKKAAEGEALPPRSGELRAELEQYLENQEVAEMDAKAKPSSEKSPRHGRRRATLIWAAAVCALVAAVPGYILISGSLRQDFGTVALDAQRAEVPVQTYEDIKSASQFSYREREEVQFTTDDSSSGVAQAPDESLDRPFQVFGRNVGGVRFAPVVTAKPEADMRGALSVYSVDPSEKSVTVGMQDSGVFSADLGIPFSQESFGTQVPQYGGVDGSLPGSGSSHLARDPNGPPATGGSLSTAKNPRLPAASTAPAQPLGERGGMEGMMGMGEEMKTATDMSTRKPLNVAAGRLFNRLPDLAKAKERAAQRENREAVRKTISEVMRNDTDEFGVELGLQDALLFSREEAKTPPQRGQRSSVLGGVEAQPTARLSALGRKPSDTTVGPVQVEVLEGLGIMILKGDRRDVDKVARLVRDAEKVGKLPVLNKDPYVRSARPSNEEYDPIVENAFLSAAENPESTFSVDVDSASYANVRRFLNSGQLPPPAAVRIEELVNYFRYDYPQPDDEVPFSVNLETAQCPWNTEHRLVRIGLKGREIDPEQRGPGNLVFLLDVSGSMRDENKLPLVQYAMGMLVEQLTEDDRVAIVTYAGEAGVALESTSGEKRKKIRRAIDNLSAGGSTHGSAGIEMAYDQAMRHFVKGGTNRVILCTDGDLNVGVTSDDELVKLITQHAKSGVFLTVLGFGTGNLKDSKMEKLADNGNGIYAYIDGRREARRVLVQQMAGSLVTIAKDVKIQVEFNPAEVASYRLIGYENRIMAAEDFANDKKDAGEIGAGHTVTALYEIVPGGGESGGELGRKLKYQRKTGRELTEAATSGELFTVSLRYKEPDGKKSKLLEFTQKDSDKTFGKASADFRFASSVAAFGMLLRNSQHAGDLTWSAAEELAVGSLGEDPGGYRNEFLELIHRAGELGSQ